MVAAAAKICYSPSGAVDILEGLDEKKTVSFLKMLRESGHLSPFEHVSFTFAIEGVSRVATHQLVRHRLASYSQQSQRYVGMSGQTCIVPPSVLENEEAHDLFIKQTRDAWSCYEQLVSLGIPKEDARFILPHGTETRLVMTMNARELHHFFSLRLCKKLSGDQGTGKKNADAGRNAAPDIFDLAGPSCVVEGICKEAHSCGEPYVAWRRCCLNEGYIITVLRRMTLSAAFAGKDTVGGQAVIEGVLRKARNIGGWRSGNRRFHLAQGMARSEWVKRNMEIPVIRGFATMVE